jgi:cellulose biosynthesis protein BcsQ
MPSSPAATSTPGPPLGRIVTFYSYKGGTGRSMALANTAWILAASGYRVAVIDWDLEAPGLHRYLRPYLRDSTLEASDGIIDFVIAFADAARDSAEFTGPGNWFDRLADLRMYAYAVAWDGFPAPGRIDFIPAGRQDAGYSVRVNSFNWQHFYTKLGGGIFLEETKRRLRAEYDYVLIDSRTGVSDTSGVCTVQMPDTLVVCFTLNEQSMDGASSTAASARQQRRLPDGSSGLRVLPVPTRVDGSEKERVDAAREVARERFNGFLDWLDDDQFDDYWGDVEIPYVPFYSLEEVLAVFDRPGSSLSVLRAIGGIVTWLTSKEITRLPSFDEEVRERELARFLRPTRRRSRPRGDARYVFYVTYAGRDRDPAMDRFIKDLETEVQLLTGLPDPVAFYDRDLISVEWSARSAEAVAASDIALVLMTPTLFGSRPARNQVDIVRAAGLRIVPVEWVPVGGNGVPTWLSSLQWFRRSGGRGLRYLARVEEGVEYRKVLDDLASTIADRWREGRLGTGAAESPRVEVMPDDAAASPVAVTIVAERKDVMKLARPGATNYGLRRRDWIPFPQDGVTAERLVLEVAAASGVAVRVLSLHGFERWLGRKPKSLASLAILDPWTLQRSSYRDQFEKWRKQMVPQESIVCLDTSEAQSVAIPDAVIVQSQNELRAQLERLLVALKERSKREGPPSQRLGPSTPPPSLS